MLRGLQVWLARTAVLALSAGAVSGQTFVHNTTDIPASGSPENDSMAENVDFADIDLDGDWDAAIANGGNFVSEQNAMWVNQGPGNVGVFVDESAARFPNVQDQSRDIEFVDFDGDGDSDIYVSNTSVFVNQTSRWWANTGVASGIYVDETLTRWVDVGANDGVTTFSSVSGALVLVSGGFIDWSCECDFGDLDNDGDLDLVHTSYGQATQADVPTRIFLNDGAGFFTEFNPSGIQLFASWIPPGTPAIWAEGFHQENTTAFDGSFADINGTPLDVEIGDFDNDWDLDILLGSRNETPRMFENRMAAGGPLVAFRDVTWDWFGDHGDLRNYEQEQGDLDGDGDLDILGCNWTFCLDEVVMRNDGTGQFGNWEIIPDSGIVSQADSEVDFIDYDNDGDLDFSVSVFFGSDRLYENDGTGTFTNVTATEMPVPFPDDIGIDIDIADVDNDGDYDMMGTQLYQAGLSNGNRLYENVSQVPDTHAPRLFRLEPTADRAASAAPTVVRVQVYDNASYYITYFNPTWLEVSVDGGPPFTVPMTSSGGQVFRGEIPGTLVGQVCYTAYSEDAYQNQGVSATECYTAGPAATVYCTPKPSSAGCVTAIATSDPVLAPVSGAGDYSVTAAPVQGGKNGLLLGGIAGPAAIPFGGGTLCLNGPKRGAIRNSGGTGPATCDGAFTAVVNDGLVFPAGFDAGPGNTIWHQWWYRDPDNGPGNLGIALSDAVQVDYQ